MEGSAGGDSQEVFDDENHEDVTNDETCKIGFFCLRKRSLFDQITEFLDRSPEGATKKQIRNAFGLSVKHMERISNDFVTLNFPVTQRKEGNSTFTKFFGKTTTVAKRSEHVANPAKSALNQFRRNFIWTYISDRPNEVTTASTILFALREEEFKTLGITTKTDRKTIFRILDNLEREKLIRKMSDLLPEEVKFTNFNKGAYKIIYIALPSLDDFEEKVQKMKDDMAIKYSKRGKRRQPKSVESNKRKRENEDYDHDISDDDDVEMVAEKKEFDLDNNLDNNYSVDQEKEKEKGEEKEDEEESREETFDEELENEVEEEETQLDHYVDHFQLKLISPSITLTDLLAYIDHDCLFTSAMSLHRFLLDNYPTNSEFTICKDFEKWPTQFMVKNYKLPLPYYGHLIKLKAGNDKAYNETKENKRFSPVDSCLLACIREKLSIEDFYSHLAKASKVDFFLFLRFIPKQLVRQLFLLMSLGLLIPAAVADEDKTLLMSNYSNFLLGYFTMGKYDLHREIVNLMSTSFIIVKKPYYAKEELTCNNLHLFWLSEIRQPLLHRPLPQHFISLGAFIDKQKQCLFFRSKSFSDVHYSKRASALVSAKNKFAMFTSLRRSKKHFSSTLLDPFERAYLKYAKTTPLSTDNYDISDKAVVPTAATTTTTTTTNTTTTTTTTASSYQMKPPKYASLHTRDWSGFMFSILAPLVQISTDESIKVSSFGEKILLSYSQDRPAIKDSDATNDQKNQVEALDVFALAHLSLLKDGIVDSRITLSTSSVSNSSDTYVEDLDISFLSSQKKSSNFSDKNSSLLGKVSADELSPQWKSMGMIKTTLVYSKPPQNNTINPITNIPKDPEGSKMDVVAQDTLDVASEECPWRFKNGAVNTTLLNNLKSKVVSILSLTPGCSCKDLCSAMVPISIEHTKMLLESMHDDGILSIKSPSYLSTLLSPFDKTKVISAVESRKNAYFLKSF